MDRARSMTGDSSGSTPGGGQAPSSGSDPTGVFSELKDLTSALTTPEMQKEIQELRKECAGYRERLENIRAATNHVTPQEKEQVSREGRDPVGCHWPRT